MASKRERVMQALLELLQNHPDPPEGLNVHRNYLRPIEVDRLPAIVIYPRPADMQPSEFVERRELGAAGKERRNLAVRFECRARASHDDHAPDSATDPLFRFVVQALHAGEQLEGLLMHAPREQSSGFGAVETEDAVLAALVIEYELHYETTRGNPDD